MWDCRDTLRSACIHGAYIVVITRSAIAWAAGNNRSVHASLHGIAAIGSACVVVVANYFEVLTSSLQRSISEGKWDKISHLFLSLFSTNLVIIAEI